VVHTLGDVIALLVVADHHGATLVVDAIVGVVVADAFDGVTGDLDVVHMRVGGDLASQHHQTGVGQGFGGDTAAGVLRKDGVEDRVRDLVSDLVGVAFRNGFRGEQVIAGHEKSSLFSMVFWRCQP